MEANKPRVSSQSDDGQWQNLVPDAVGTQEEPCLSWGMEEAASKLSFNSSVGVNQMERVWTNIPGKGTEV